MIIALGIFFLSLFVIRVVLEICIDFEHDNNLYCKLYLKEKRKLWQELISNVDDFHYECNWGLNYRFSSDNYTAYVWEDGECSIHLKNGTTCVLSSFDKRMSRKMAELLMSKLQNIKISNNDTN